MVLLESLGVLPCSDFVQRPRVSEDDQRIELIWCRKVLREPLRQDIILAGLGASLDSLVPKLVDR